MRGLLWNEKPATGWFVKAPSRRGLQRLFLWCLVVAAAQVLLSSVRIVASSSSATANSTIVATIQCPYPHRYVARDFRSSRINNTFFPDAATGRLASGRVVVTGGGGNIGTLLAMPQSCIHR